MGFASLQSASHTECGTAMGFAAKHSVTQHLTVVGSAVHGDIVQLTLYDLAMCDRQEPAAFVSRWVLIVRRTHRSFLFRM